MKNFSLPISISLPVSIVVAGLIIAGAIVYTQKPQPAEVSKEKKEGSEVLVEKENRKEEKDQKVEITITKDDHIRGNPQAPITIVEYSDLRCSFCKRFHSVLQQLLDNYPNQVRWVYKHFPLGGSYGESRRAAEASECSWEQKGNEGFWQFVDGLFENQEKLGKELYQELAQKLNLNMDKFNECLTSRKYRDKVEANYQEGKELGIRGTPTSFVNGEEISGAVSYSYLESVVEKALD